MKGSVVPKNSDYTVDELWELVHVLEDADAEHRRALCVLEFDAKIQKKRFREMEERYTWRITQLEEEVAREKRRKQGPIDVDLVIEESHRGRIEGPLDFDPLGRKNRVISHTNN